MHKHIIEQLKNIDKNIEKDEKLKKDIMNKSKALHPYYQIQFHGNGFNNGLPYLSNKTKDEAAIMAYKSLSVLLSTFKIKRDKDVIIFPSGTRVRITKLKIYHQLVNTSLFAVKKDEEEFDIKFCDSSTSITLGKKYNIFKPYLKNFTKVHSDILKNESDEEILNKVNFGQVLAEEKGKMLLKELEPICRRLSDNESFRSSLVTHFRDSIIYKAISNKSCDDILSEYRSLKSWLNSYSTKDIIKNVETELRYALQKVKNKNLYNAQLGEDKLFVKDYSVSFNNGFYIDYEIQCEDEIIRDSVKIKYFY